MTTSTSAPERDPNAIAREGLDQGPFRAWRHRAACGLVLVAALAATVPTVGDIGLTWDEPAYKFSQMRSAQWWERLASAARGGDDLAALLDPDALLFYWTYARHGINFHPPLAGQASVLSRAVFGRWMKDLPARRMASVIEFSLAVTLLFGFMARRYGRAVGIVAAGALLLMPRVYGDAHIAGTDVPGLLLWPATALAFWKGLHEPRAGRWRILVGVLMGLAFVEKMAAVFVLAPLLFWLAATRLPGLLRGRVTRADWLDGVFTLGLPLAPILVAFVEMIRLSRLLPPLDRTDLFEARPATVLPGLILAAPLVLWLVRRGLGRAFPKSRMWGVERPALETLAAVLAFAPVVSWLGNPAWWRETLPRLAHYYLLNFDRRGALPDIRILYLGRIYEFALPWHNAWILIGVTVPAAILAAAAAGLLFVATGGRRDRFTLFVLVQFLTLPALRMLPTPAHDGVRLFLPTFFFLAALAGWGAVWVADGLARLVRARSAAWPRTVVAALVLVPSAWQLVKIHPYELSYYNELVGGPIGARALGLETTYWYDAFDPRTLERINEALPPDAMVDFLNERALSMTFLELQSLGQLRGDVRLGWSDLGRFPHVWLLTQDAKASGLTRLIHAMVPSFASRPEQLGGIRVASVADPAAVERADALWLLAGGPDRRGEPLPAPEWARGVPGLSALWGEGRALVPLPTVYEPAFAWASTDPDGLRLAARTLAERRGDPGDDPSARRLRAMLGRFPITEPEHAPSVVLKARPEALLEAVEVLIRRPDAVRTVLTSVLYTEPSTIGGYLDRDLPALVVSPPALRPRP